MPISYNTGRAAVFGKITRRKTGGSDPPFPGWLTRLSASNWGRLLTRNTIDQNELIPVLFFTVLVQLHHGLARVVNVVARRQRRGDGESQRRAQPMVRGA